MGNNHRTDQRSFSRSSKEVKNPKNTDRRSFSGDAKDRAKTSNTKTKAGTKSKSSSFRVISGEFKGVKILSPDSDSTHPMGNREKLALFNMVNPAEMVVLDAYAGSGALGIEALSRGAQAVTLVENSPVAGRIIQENLAGLAERDTSIRERARVEIMKVSRFVRENSGREFDLILADPPYQNIDRAELEELSKLLAQGGVLVLSSPASAEPPELSDLEVFLSRTYAGARLSLYYHG